MSRASFMFGDVVVVEEELIGVVVKSWQTKDGYSHEVYVRSLNAINDYPESEMRKFVYSKELRDEEKEYYW